MEILFILLALIGSVLSFVTLIFLLQSNLKFTKGDIQKITSNFVWGTIFMFGVMIAQFYVEFLHLEKTLIDLIKYIFMLVSFTFYLIASYKLYKISKVLGFASKEMPEKLKKILKS